ncbi:hypothetical protein CROQUDRAFT_35926 [Cronartium quercuum f. sp. fusiforme G11]|uniref:EF-hand domain-containing protein n=1 Tax=Cronartium quercuum f. sp. fusiforme G11 TaxID=708437 RepID=A0A9P6NX55_9BASI|nr:hypothetical protein CROQUDRAFT_35926 [Cronartium quercuum f. sp. fusiforme G11]
MASSPPSSPEVLRTESQPLYPRRPLTSATPETTHHTQTRPSPASSRTDLPSHSGSEVSSPVYYSHSAVSAHSTMPPPPEYLSRSQWNRTSAESPPPVGPSYNSDRFETVAGLTSSFSPDPSGPNHQNYASSVEIKIETLPNSPLQRSYQLSAPEPDHGSYSAHTCGITDSSHGKPSDAQAKRLIESLAAEGSLESGEASRPRHLADDEHTDSDNEAQNFDDYDWENDDDLEGDVRFDDLNHHQEGQHQHHRRRTLARRLSPYNVIKYLITTFIGHIFLSIALIIPPLVLRFDGYYQTGESDSDVHSRYVYDNVAAWTYWISYNLLASWAIHFLVELTPRVLISLVAVVWGDVHEGIKSYIEIIHAAKAWLKAIVYAAMISSAEEESRASYTNALKLVVELFFFFVLVLSIEKLVLLSISMSFHRVAYSDRIQKVTRSLAVIDILQDYRPKRKTLPGNGMNSRRASGDILTFKTLSAQFTSPLRKTQEQKQSPLSPLAEPKKRGWWKGEKQAHQRSTNVEMSERPEGASRTIPNSDHPYQFQNPSAPDLISQSNPNPALKRRNSQTTFALIARRGASAAKIARAAMKDPVAVVGKKSGLALDINNPTEARKLARRIFFSFRGSANRNYLVPSDFYPAFPTERLAKEAFSIFDSDGNGDISRTEVKNEIFRVYKERRALAQSLQDVGHAIGRLDSILLGLGAIIFLFIVLSVVGIDFSKTLTSASTILIALAFVFKETAANVFDSIILLFCSHPLDTGDRIVIQNDAGVDEILTVKQMGLLSTVFVRWDGTEWFAPNAVLGKKFIINLRRSTNQFENATVQFGWDTPLEKIDELEEKLNYWLQTDEQRRFEPGTAAVIQQLVNQQYIEITFGMVHRENWQDWGGRWNRRTAFHAAINYYSRQLGITFYGSEQPVEMRDLGPMKQLFMEEEDVEEIADEKKENRLSDREGSPTPGEPVPEVRIPEVFGFSPPPESGTGMRKRKRMSKKKAMCGDS